jgi:hypothetical protein
MMESNKGEGRKGNNDMHRIKECKNGLEGTILPRQRGRKEGKQI